MSTKIPGLTKGHKTKSLSGWQVGTASNLKLACHLLIWKFYNMRNMLKVDQYFIFMFCQRHCFMRKIRIYCFCKISVFLATAMFVNFLVVAIGHWLNFEFSTIFLKRVSIHNFWQLFVRREIVFVQISSRIFLPPLTIKRRNFAQWELVLFCTIVGTREVHK